MRWSLITPDYLQLCKELLVSLAMFAMLENGLVTIVYIHFVLFPSNLSKLKLLKVTTVHSVVM